MNSSEENKYLNKMLKGSKLEGKARFSQLGGGFKDIIPFLIAAEQKYRWQLASSLSVLIES